MKKIIYTNAEGRLCVVTPSEGARLALAVDDDRSETPRPVDTFLRRWPVNGVNVEWAETADEFCARIAMKDVPADAAHVQIVDESAIPSDRTFRNAWKAGTGCVEHDMDRAREIHRNRLRAERAPKLAALDVEYQRADEAGDAGAKRAIAAQKQALRDAPADPCIAEATTPEELKAAIPESLK